MLSKDYWRIVGLSPKSYYGSAQRGYGSIRIKGLPRQLLYPVVPRVFPLANSSIVDREVTLNLFKIPLI